MKQIIPIPFSLPNITGETLTRVLSSCLHAFCLGDFFSQDNPCKRCNRSLGRWWKVHPQRAWKLPQKRLWEGLLLPGGWTILWNSLPIWIIWWFCNTNCIKCCTSTAKVQTTYRALVTRTDNPLEPPVLSCICHFLRKASVRYFIRSLPVWEVSCFQHVTITLATNKQSKVKKFADSVRKKNPYQTSFSFLPSFPPMEWGPSHTPTWYTQFSSRL